MNSKENVWKCIGKEFCQVFLMVSPKENFNAKLEGGQDFSKAVEEYIDYYNNKRVQEKQNGCHLYNTG